MLVWAARKTSAARFEVPPGTPIANFTGDGARFASWKRQGSMPAYANEQLDPTLDWKAVEWLRGVTKLPLVVKGVMRTDDATRAVAGGEARVRRVLGMLRHELETSMAIFGANDVAKVDPTLVLRD